MVGMDEKAQGKPCSLTIEKLREFRGFENVSDEEAEKVIHSVKELSVILYQYYLIKKTNRE